MHGADVFGEKEDEKHTKKRGGGEERRSLPICDIISGLVRSVVKEGKTPVPNVGATPPPLRSGRDIARGKKAACMGRASAAIIEKWVVEEEGGGRGRRLRRRKRGVVIKR